MGYGVFEELEKLRKQQEAARSKYGNTTKRTVTPVPEDTDYGVFNELRKIQQNDLLRAQQQEEKKRTTTVNTNRGSTSGSIFDEDDDIAPVRKDKEEEEERTWFQKGAFKDGFSLKNTAKAIIGSAEDVIENVGTGIAGMGEKIVDALAWAAPYVAQSQFYQNGGDIATLAQRKQFEENIAQSKADSAAFIQKDLYDEEKLVKQIYSNNTISKRLLNADPDDISVFGEKSDALAQSTGQLAATAALSAVGVPWFLTTGATSFGGEVENALNQGATMEQAGLSGFITVGAEILTEKISGGIKFGGKTLDEGLTKVIARSISDKTARTLVKLGFDAAGEGFEEVLSGAISAVGQRISYDKDKDISLDELFFSEEAFESFIGGAVMGGGFSTINAVKAKKNGVDYVSELTTNEQKVVDKEYKERVAEAEKDGKVSQSEKSKIYDRVLMDMEKGYISTDSIEAALGGDTYNNYRSTTASENNILKEFEELGKKQNPTLSETHRYNELVEQVKEIKEKKAGEQLKGKLSEEVKNLVAGDRLAESYNERSRRQQAFEADLSQYDEKQQAVVKKAVESGILNNTNRTHEFVDMVAKISADKGVLFDFTNNAKLKESGFSLNGASVNGYKTSDGIVVNVDSAKSRSFVVGHEVTHVLEGTELYGELQKAVFDYAKMKGEYDSRLASVTELYKKYDPEADPMNELTSDLVGEYLFSDPEFVNNLSTEHRNVFQKVYDEIKYMLKVATAGSKEARELEKVKKIFEQAYRESGTKNTADSGVEYSLNIKHTDGSVEKLADARSLTSEQATNYLHQAKAGALRGETYIPVRKDTPQVIIDTLAEVNEKIDNNSLVMQVRKAQQAMSAGKSGKQSGKKGNNVRSHGLSEAQIVEIVNKLDDPTMMIYQTNRQDKSGNPIPNNVAVFVQYNNGGNEGLAVIEFDSSFDSESVGTEFGDTNYHTVVTVFEPDVERNGVEFDYAEELLSNPDNFELEIKRRQDDESATREKHPNTSSELPSSAVNIAENQGNVKRQFSLSDPVEETKDLVALHNLTADKLSKSLELGGLPMPSLAITKADIPHSNFGDITLVFGKETVDPKANKKNKVYSADAWTPVFPRVEYEADSKVGNQISKKLSELEGKIDDTFQRDLRRIQYGFEDYLNSQGGEEGLIQHAMENYGLKAAYLEEQGKHIEKVTVQQEAEKGFNPDNADKYQKIMDILGVTTAEEIGNVNLKDARDNHGAELEAVYPGITKTAMRMGRMFGAVKSFLENQNSAPVYNTVTDTNATRRAVDEALDTEGFEAWTRNLFSGIVKDSGIYNNKDLYTPSGNRRSFKQTHLPVTLENIVKAMATQNGGNSKNVSGFNGIKTLRAATAETFKSVADMHNRKDRLQHLTEEQADALNNEMQNRLFEIMHTIDNEGRQSSERNPYIRMDSIGETIAEIGESGKYNVADIQKTFREYGKEISDDTALAVKQLLFDVTQMPVNIFEAKPQRVVSFDEAKAFVVPNNVDTKLKQELLNRGYSIAEYDPNVEGDRQKVVNQFEEYRFSLSDAGAPQNRVSDPLTDLRLEGREDIAPVAENATTNATVAENATVSNTESVEDLFPDDTAPIQEEYEFLLAEREDIKGAMDAFAAVGDNAGAEGLMAEYEAVQARIAAIEADEADWFASIGEADAPPEIEYDSELDSEPEDVADNVPLTKVLVNDLAKQVKSQLGLGNNRTAEVRELIERYSNEEFPSKAHLYTEIQERFGKYTESAADEDLKAIKSLLRRYPINVDESIKGEIADYGQLMRSNFGKVRFAKDGLPVDVAYKEFQEALPGYFPEDIYVPTDQLMRIIEVANMDTMTETEYEIDWQTLEDVTDTIMNGVAEFKQNRKETLANRHGRESFNSLMEDADQYAPPIPENIAPVRPAIQSVQAEPDDIAPVFDTSSGQQSILPEEEAPKKITRKELHLNIMDDIKTQFRERGFEFDDVLKDAKDLSTFATVDNTPQRVMEKALGYKEGQALSDLTVNKVAQNETEGIRWLNSFTDKKSGLLAKISKQYGIKPGSKASAAAQMYAEGFYVGENDAIIAYGDKELAADFPDRKVQDNIKKLSRDPRIRQIYDETLAAINESRTRNAYPEIPRLDNYFLHFRAMEDTFSRLGLPFNPNDIRAKDLPTDLNGVTADLKPGQPYFASAKHREGKRTSFDLLGGLEKYLTSAKNQIYHIDDIQTLRALRNYVAETYGQATGLQDLDLLSNEEAEQRIEAVYNSHLSTFAKFLNEEANVLAGKTSLIDRGLEGVIGRRGITFLDTLNKQVGANMVGFNVSSSLTNFLAPVQAFAKTNKADFVKAIAQTAYNKMASVFGKGDNFAEESPVMIRRKGAEQFYRTPYQKVADAGYVLMGVVDDISTELIARTKYNEFTRKGMESQKAHYETDKWVSRLMGDRSLGQQPQLYNSKMLGLFTKFQLEVRNQLDSQFYDTIQEAKVSTEEIENKLLRNAKKAAKITSTFAQLAAMQHLFGKAFESVAGYNPAFDIIEALIKAFGWDDEEDDEDSVLDNIEEGFLSLLGDLPYTSTLTGGRIPIASALPVTEFIKGEDQYGNEKNRWQTLGEAAPYYVLPGGYGQIKKTKAGLEMFDEDLPIAGSYTDSGGLRFPVEDTTGNRLQAALFGQWASENARDYFDNERKPLKDKQIQEFIDSDMPIRDYWDYREGLAEHEKLGDKADYIDSLDLPISTKNMLVNNAADRKEPIDMTDYGEYGSLEEMDFATKNPEKYEVAVAIGGYARYMGYQAGMKDMKLAEKVDYVSKLDLTVEQKNLLINSETDRKEPIDLTGYENFSNFEEFEFAKKNPEAYAMAKTVGGYEAYTEYSDALGDIKADKDEFGNSISGTRKTKVAEYISSLDIPMVEKYILFKSQYPATDDYNYEIIDYVNSMSDMTFEEKIEVLRKLDFDVDAEGNIYW